MPHSAKTPPSAIGDLPFSRLELSQRAETVEPHEDLPEDMTEPRLPYRLNVPTVIDEPGTEFGMFASPSDGGHFHTPNPLAEENRLAKDAHLPCPLSENEQDEAALLATPVERVGPCPTDPFNPFIAPSHKDVVKDDIGHLKARLADHALAVCRYYLSCGQRAGNYWTVGNVHNAPGHSMFVRLYTDASGGKAGRWRDAATGEYGDLFDIIGLNLGLRSFADIVDEAHRFIGNRPSSKRPRPRADQQPRFDRTDHARKLLHIAGPITNTLGETYLNHRCIDSSVAAELRFVSSCYCRPTAESDVSEWPAIIAPVTDLAGTLMAVHRIYLDTAPPNDISLGKAPISRPKRSLGHLNGHAVRFGPDKDIVLVGEGIENVLSVRTVFPSVTVHAAVTAGNLGDYQINPAIRRLLIAGDADDAGRRAVSKLTARAATLAIPVTTLWPLMSDYNLDLCQMGVAIVRERILAQIGPLTDPSSLASL